MKRGIGGSQVFHHSVECLLPDRSVVDRCLFEPDPIQIQLIDIERDLIVDGSRRGDVEDSEVDPAIDDRCILPKGVDVALDYWHHTRGDEPPLNLVHGCDDSQIVLAEIQREVLRDIDEHVGAYSKLDFGHEHIARVSE